MWPPHPDSVVIVLVGVLVFAAHMPLWQQVVRQSRRCCCPEGGGFIAIAVPQPAAEETPRAHSDN